MNKDIMIKVAVTGLTIDPFTSMPIVILKDDKEKHTLPIWIGLIEASSIATELEKVELSRPMTHDLLKNILSNIGVDVEKITIHDLADNTFYAKIFLKRGKDSWVVDSRPSDAIALALRCETPIYVSKSVIDKSRKIDITTTMDDTKEERRKKWAEILDNLSPEDFGKYKM
ncbi:MAG: bifunctional nuclease domain-containing protein [Pseudomonadota bacterium]